MNLMQNNSRRRTGFLFVLVWVLMCCFGNPEGSCAQDARDGHDHASERVAGGAHADEKESDAHAGHNHSAHAAEADPVEEGAGEEDHSGHDHSAHAAETEGLSLTPELQKRFGIVVQPAGAGCLRNEVSLPGEIVFNEDLVVHLVPRVAGIAREVRKSMGDHAKAGEILAVIESRELADAKSEYLAAKARAELAEKHFAREKALREKEISSEQDYLEAEQSLAEARIKRQSTGQQLYALGLLKDEVNAVGDEHEAITRYEIRSPIEGVVTEKHISLGESLAADAPIFTVVDTRSVWVNLTVYTKDLSAVRPGQDVELRLEHNGAQAQGKVAMRTPFVEESTRSATARVVLDNHDGRWLPGTFVTGFIRTSEENLPVVVPRDAVQNIEGRDVVFVENEDTFEMVTVTLGRKDRVNAEVLTGLEPGMHYVSTGAFQLKASIITSSLGSHAGHGH